MKGFIVILACLVFLSACHTPRYVYAPSPPNNPYFKRKGDSKISAYYSLGGNDGSYSGEKNHGLDIQTAYAFSDHFALTADHFSRKEKDIYNYDQYNTFDSSVINYNRNITSFGAGYFIGLNQRRKVTFNLYGGVGFGKFNINDKGIDDSSSAYTRFHRADITKWYLQPGFNFMPGSHFWCSVNTRFVFAKYSGINTSYSDDEMQHLDLINLQNRTLTFFEPSFNMQIAVPHCPWLKINGGFTFSANITTVNDIDNVHYDSRGFTGSFGVTFDLSKIHDK